MAIIGLYLEPDSAPYTSTTLSTNAALVNGDRFTSAIGNYWATHYSYGIDFEMSVTISGLIAYGNLTGTPTSWYSNYYSFSIYKSDDNSTWTYIENFDAPPIVYSALNKFGIEFIFSTTQSARYFKIVYTGPGWASFNVGGASAKIGEILPHFVGIPYTNRLRLTIDGSKITENLNNFPINITVASGTGINSFNATVVLDELTYDNRKRIAITDSNDIKLYTEIEYWSDAYREAILWVKVPTVSSGTDTVLYLYYDNTGPENIEYVSDSALYPSQNVWDDNYIAVWHMAQDPTGVGYCMLDSTSRGHHGDPQAGIGSDDLVDGKIGKAIEFDGVGTGDRINFATSTDFQFGTNNFTIEHIIYPTSNGTVWCNYEAVNKLHVPYFDSGTSARIIINGTDNVTGIVTTASVYQQFIAVRSGNELKVYINNSQSGSTGNVTGVSIGEDTNNFIGCSTNAGHALSGRVDEVRISNIDRSSAWIKATYHSNWNDLITFSISEILIFYFSNPIPTHLSTVYGTSHTLYLTTTISGGAPGYIYDASFYNAYNSNLIDTASGIQSGNPASVLFNTPSGINYQWYVTATSSGSQGTSSTYTFTNKFLCSGQTQVSDVPASGIPVRLYLRDTGEYVGGTTSAGISGTFSIETTHNAYHYAVALYGSSDTNALIADWLLPD